VVPDQRCIPEVHQTLILTQHTSVRVSEPNTKPAVFRKAGLRKSLMWKRGTTSYLMRYLLPPKTSGTRSLHGKVSLFLLRALLMRPEREANPLQNFRLPRVFIHVGRKPPKRSGRSLLIPEQKTPPQGLKVVPEMRDSAKAHLWIRVPTLPGTGLWEKFLLRVLLEPGFLMLQARLTF